MRFFLKLPSECRSTVMKYSDSPSIQSDKTSLKASRSGMH